MNKIIVENDTMRFYSTPVPIPVGGSQWSKIFFMFSDEWEDLRKIAQFRQGELKINVDIDSNNFCYVPNEMLPDMCGELSIVGYPQDTSSAVIATANSLMLSFVQGFESGGEPAVPPTPDLYQKLIKEFAESGGGNPDAVLYSKQELTEEQQKQARTNIGALDENIKTTPVDIGVGLGSTVYYVQSGWLRPCPDNADKELKLQYRRVFEFIGSQYLKPSSQDMLLQAKSAYALYQKGLASESIKVTYNPLAATQVYVTWRINIISNKHYFYYAQVSTAYQYTCTYCVEDDALVTETYERPVYRTSNGVGEQDGVGQFRMKTNPTEDMHIATKQYVDTAKTEAQQLGLTTATPGKTIKVKTVQDGKPTEWEAVDMPGGDKWEKLYDGTIQIEQETMLIEVDIPRSDSAKEFHVYLHFAKNVAQEWDSNKRVQVHVNGAQLGYSIIYNKLTSDFYCFAKQSYDTVRRVEVMRAIGINPETNLSNIATQLLNWSVYEQTNTGKIRISFAAAYAGSIELLVYGRY